MDISLNNISSVNLESINDLSIRKFFASHQHLGFIVFKIPKGRHIYRSLKMSSEYERYIDKARISYNPNPNSYGRANIPNHPIFYGSITTDKAPIRADMTKEQIFQNTVHGYLINVSECSDLVIGLDEEPIIGKEIYTIGMWEVKRDIEVAVIHDVESRNYLSAAMKADCEQFYSSHDKEQKEIFTSLQNVLSVEFSKEVKKKRRV